MPERQYVTATERLSANARIIYSTAIIYCHYFWQILLWYYWVSGSMSAFITLSVVADFLGRLFGVQSYLCYRACWA